MMKNVAELSNLTANSPKISGEGSSQISNRPFSMNTLRIWAMLLLLCLSVGQMWGYYYLPSDFEGGSWNNTSYQMSSGNDITFYAVNSTSGKSGDKYFFRLYMTGWGGQSSENLIASASGDALDSYGVSDDGAMWIVLNQIADVHFSVNTSNNKLTITANPSCYFIKYKWDGTNYTYSGMMVSNLDGTYSVSGHYHGLSYNHARRGSDGGAGGGWHENGATIVGDETLDEGDNCIFTLNPADDYSLTIRKCNTVNQEDSKNSYVYFDNTNADWTGTNRYFVIGRPETSKVYQMYAIANTKLWYIPDSKALDNWGDCGYYGIVVNSTAWSDGDWGPNNLANANQHYTAPYLTPQNLDSKYYYIVKKADDTDGGAVTFEKQTMSYTCLNLIVGYQYNVDGTDMTSGGAPAQITMTSYAFSNRFTATANEAQTIIENSSGTYSKSISCAYRGTTTLTMSNLNNGYLFKGWYNGETQLSKDASYTFYPDGAMTVTAKFETRWSVAGSWDGSTWSETAYMFGNIGTDASGNDTCSYSFTTPTTIDENANYRFKIIDHSVNPKSWYGLSSTNIIEYTTDDMPWTLGTGEGYEANCEINTAAAGTYKFIWNITQHKLTVTYPISYQITMATNPSTGGSTTTPSGTFWVGTSAFDITATPSYSHYFTGWSATNDVDGDFGDDSEASTTFTATANTTLTAAMPAYSVFIEGTFQVRNSSGATIGIGGASWATGSFAIKMEYDATNNLYYLNTYSTPQELAKKDVNDAYFYLRTSELPNSFSGGGIYYANELDNNRLSASGVEAPTKLGNVKSRGFLFTGTEEANVTLYFDGTNVWYETETVNTFTDASNDHKWSTASNWSSGSVPLITDIVYINKPVTVDIDHAKAKRIILDQSSTNTGKLTIQANKGLELLQTIKRTTDGSNRLATRAEDLVLESDATGNASLIFDNSNSDAATVKMYSIGDIDGDTWNWQFMGTPFTSANALYSYYGAYLYEWQSTGTWDAVANGGTMSPFTGYCITQDEPTTYVMDGTLNPNDNVAINIPASKEFVMANSWTAPISVCNFTETTLPLDNQTIYLFNTGYAPKESGGAKSGSGPGTFVTMPIASAIYTGNYLIAPMEGYYVDNTSGSAETITLKYDELVRPSGSHTDIVAGAMHAPKRVDAVAEPDVMKIKATGSRYADRVVILAREDFSTAFDNGWDGKNINEPGVAPIIYALRADGTKDAVSAIPSFEGTVVGFRQGEDNQYTFSFDYDGEDIWYLNDLKQQKSTLIDAEHSYSFSTAADDAEARFIISATPIANMPTGCGQIGAEAEKVKKVIINDQLYIIRAGRMYNAEGTLVK